MTTPRVASAKPGRAYGSGLWVHLGILGVATIAAVAVWTRDKEPLAVASGDVTVWSGRSGDIERIAYESKTKNVHIDAKRDEGGRYFVGVAEREGHAPLVGPDAGAPPQAPTKTSHPFISVGVATKVADAFGPLKASRALGRIPDARAAEFGLAEPEATIVVKLGGAERKLLLGAATPGGGDRYAREASTGEVFVLRGEPIRNLEGGDSVLMERDLHEWKESEVTRAHIEAAGKAREIVRGGPETKRFWADPAKPDANDETLGNWMSKLEKLRPTEYVLDPPEPKTPVLRIQYEKARPIGFIELVKVPQGDKPAYFIRTERTRIYGKVVNTLAEQVEQDLAAVVK